METFRAAWTLMTSGDPTLWGIIGLSFQVSLSATALATLLGAPLGALLAVCRFPGRRVLLVLFSTLMALPPVVAGLFVYLSLSRAGPLGSWGLLFTPTAMVIAQTLLILPIVTVLTHAAVRPLYIEYRDMLACVGARAGLTLRTLLWDARFSVVTAILAGFGRAIAEVGAVLIVGGNIAGVTRVMTTTIALETSKGDLELALALGLVLLAMALVVNLIMQALALLGHAYEPT